MERIRKTFLTMDILTDQHELPIDTLDMINTIREDVEWLYDRMVTAWSFVAQYQEELKNSHEQCSQKKSPPHCGTPGQTAFDF